MNIFLLITGILLIVIIALDLLLTALQSAGAGYISGPVSAGIWRLLKKISGTNSSSRVLHYSGFIIVLFLLIIWVLGMWSGYLLLYMADENSIVQSSTKMAADVWEKIYFSGFTISTLGIGDFVPNSDFYRVVSAMNALNGLILITMAITYLIPVLSAVTFKRQLSSYIYNMGNSPVEILKNGWDGKQLTYLDTFLEDLHPMILNYSQNHLAYPVIHYFHRQEVRYATPVNLVRLDEALTLALNFFPKETLSNPLLLKTVKEALSDYLSTLHKSFIKPAEAAPEAGYQEDLLRAFPGVDIKYDPEIFQQTEHRRKLLLQLIESDNREWNIIYGNENELFKKNRNSTK